MNKFKEAWEIKENWQLLFPALGLIGLGFSAFRIAYRVWDKQWVLISITTLALFFIFLVITLRLFKWLSKKWELEYRWEMIRVFIVFAVTGSSSVFVGRPIMEFIGITKENLNPFLYWFLFIIIGLFFYQILLVTFGWLFGQFNFFWEFEKKMLRRFGLKQFID